MQSPNSASCFLLFLFRRQSPEPRKGPWQVRPTYGPLRDGKGKVSA
jgi:hypothetical protein